MARESSTVFWRLFMHAHGPKNTWKLGTQSLRLCPAHGRKLHHRNGGIRFDSYRYESIEYIYFFSIHMYTYTQYICTYVRTTN